MAMGGGEEIPDRGAILIAFLPSRLGGKKSAPGPVAVDIKSFFMPGSHVRWEFQPGARLAGFPGNSLTFYSPPPIGCVNLSLLPFVRWFARVTRPAQTRLIELCKSHLLAVYLSPSFLTHDIYIKKIMLHDPVFCVCS